ncbi:R3H domain containing-like isoform X1 [Anguilla rostrata]|uniref:R3H domain containing-like isoform X1 n=2 Tax=Anguilla rostrata TaxID=7938 RepID=UPI0030CFBE57
MCVTHAWLLFAALLWMIPDTAASTMLSNATDVELSNSPPASDSDIGGLPCLNFSRSRRKRYISSRDLSALLDYHNRVRSQVFPPAANMEYMVWDERLAKTAESWASRCIWDHGPSHALRYMGQNLSIHSGRYRSVIDLVRSWHEERNSFGYPNKCSGSVCTHYTQMVWATSNRIGCAINRCANMNVYGSPWKQAVVLVCNYSIKGNWIGEAPYRTGRPCSACPASYGGSCSRNLCSSSGSRSNKINRF